MTVRLAIVGSGVMGADHARIFTERLLDAEVRILSPPDRGRGQAIRIETEVFFDNVRYRSAGLSWGGDTLAPPVTLRHHAAQIGRKQG
jgi:hypothetical protein